MTDIPVADLPRLGFRQVGKALRWVGPHGEVYTRAVMGRPSLTIIQLDGSKLHLAVVPTPKKVMR